MMGDQSVVLSKGAMDVEKAALTQHRIELYDDTTIKQKPRHFSGLVVEAVALQCQSCSMHSLDIIEPSKSSRSSPVIPIRKKDGNI